MSGEALNPQQFKYHVTFARNREAIQGQGLLRSKGVRSPHRVYVSDEPEAYMGPGKDMWKVNVTDVPLRPDRTDLPGRAWYAQRDIHPDRLSLHQEAQ